MELLLNSIKQGDHQAFKRLFDTYYKKVYRFAVRFVSDDHAEDIVQNVFIHIWKSRNNIDDNMQLDALLFNTTKQEVANWYRKQREERLDDEHTVYLVSEEEDSEQQPLFLERKKLLDQSIALLPVRRREVFTLYHEDGLSYQEIAQYLHISTSAVGNHLYQATEFLRKQVRALKN